MNFKSPNYFLFLAAFCVNLLSLTVATVFSWTSPSIPKLYSNDTSINPLGQPITSSQESLIASAPSIGAIVGTILAGIVAEKNSRKITLIFSSLPILVSYVVVANATSLYLFVIPRLVLGLSAGCILTILPSYVAEISEDSNRGSLGAIFGIMSATGNLCALVIGPLISIRIFAYLLLLPVILFLIFIYFVPESPYHLLAKHDTNRAEKVLKQIRLNCDIQKEVLYLQDVIKENGSKKSSFKDIMSSSAAKNGLLVSCGLLAFQQFMGIPFILLYLQPILDASGNAIPSSIASIIIGIVQLLSCTLSTFLIDSLGRKILLYVSSAGCSISLFSLGTFFYLQTTNFNIDSIFWLPLTSLILFYIFFNTGYSTIPWNICGELFSTNVKSICVSVATFTGTSLGLIIIAGFPFIRDAFGMSGVFFLFGGLAILSNIFVIIFVPETKGKSFEQIQMALCRNKY